MGLRSRFDGVIQGLTHEDLTTLKKALADSAYPDLAEARQDILIEYSFRFGQDDKTAIEHLCQISPDTRDRIGRCRKLANAVEKLTEYDIVEHKKQKAAAHTEHTKSDSVGF